MVGKVYRDAPSALAGVVFDGMTLMSGGFGLSGNPENLVTALKENGVKNLTVISNNCGADGFGLWVLLNNGQIKKMISSYVGENKLFESLYLSGQLELELNPQGTLAERIRAGGAGIPAFYTKTGVGTVVAEGKPTEDVRGRDLCAGDLAARRPGDRQGLEGRPEGNLVYRKTARNFNPNMATAAKVTIAEVEELVPNGSLDPDQIHTPGIFVNRILQGTDYDKRIEFRTTRPRPAMDGAATAGRSDPMAWTREEMAARAAQGTQGRLLRQSGDRHSHPGGELHSPRA